jgi:hypothetical protein
MNSARVPASFPISWLIKETIRFMERVYQSCARSIYVSDSYVAS